MSMRDEGDCWSDGVSPWQTEKDRSIKTVSRNTISTSNY